MVTAVLMVKNPDSTRWEGTGGREFREMPRIGEFIEMDVNGVGISYRVVGVFHPTPPAPDTVGDIYAVRVGETPSVLIDLFKRS